MGKLKQYMRPYVYLMVLTMLSKFVSALLELSIPYLMEIILDEQVPSGNQPGIYKFGILMAVCAALSAFFNILSNVMAAHSSGNITKAIRHDLFKKLESFSSRQMDHLTIPSAESRLTSDTYNVNMMLNRLQRLGTRAPILLIGGIMMMLSMDVPLSLILLGMLPPISLLVYVVTKRSIPIYVHQQQVLDKVVGTVLENITGIRVVKALCKTEYEKHRFDDVNAELTVADRKAGMVTAVTNPATTLFLNLGLTMVVVFGAYRVNSGACPSGVVVAFLQYFATILAATLGVTRIFIFWNKGKASSIRIEQVFNEPEDMAVSENQTEPEEQPPCIEFRNVSFSYTGKGSNISNLSFKLEPGQTLGILGPTGSGKTTILNLMLRLYDPDEGQVLIDGQDARTIPHEQLRKKFGIVFQNDFVMEGTISDNIRFFRDVEDSTLQDAAKDAQAHFIQDKEGGMDAEVLIHGNNLSGGQKQRLLISRALAAKPDILILDDASSALDYRTDANLRHSLHDHYEGTTMVIVAQRISSLLHADLILVLSDGMVIGAGTHESLMKTCDEYRFVAQAQMGEGKENA